MIVNGHVIDSNRPPQERKIVEEKEKEKEEEIEPVSPPGSPPERKLLRDDIFLLSPVSHLGAPFRWEKNRNPNSRPPHVRYIKYIAHRWRTPIFGIAGILSCCKQSKNKRNWWGMVGQWHRSLPGERVTNHDR